MSLPDACDAFQTIIRSINNRPLAVFLDYDGTLTPIVRRPALANLNPETRYEINQLAHVCSLSIVSGRDLEDVQKRVGIENIAYAGSHGFDILDRDGTRFEAANRNEVLALLNRVASSIRAHLLSVDGVVIEQKRFSLAVHYRNVASQNIAEVQAAVERTMQSIPGLEMAGGKMVFDIKPSIDWHKGRAVEWLLHRLDSKRSPNQPETFAIYIGDDTTDEDAFRVLGERGVGILVAERREFASGKQTAASFRLNDSQQVCAFMRLLVEELSRTQKSAENPRFF